MSLKRKYGEILSVKDEEQGEDDHQIRRKLTENLNEALVDIVIFKFKKRQSPLIVPSEIQEIKKVIFGPQNTEAIGLFEKRVKIDIGVQYDQQHIIPKIMNLIEIIKETRKGDDPKKDKSKNTKEVILPAYFDKNKILEDAIKLYDARFNVSYISNLLGIKKTVIWNIVQKRRKKGIAYFEKVGRRPKITVEFLQFIKDQLSNQNLVTTSLKSLKAGLVTKFNLEPNSISLSTVHKMIKMANFSWKKISKTFVNINADEFIKERREVALKFLNAVLQKKYIVFVDETIFCNHFSKIYGYSEIGKKCMAQIPQRSKRVSIIAAITTEKLLAYQMFKGSITQDDYGGFIVLLLNKLKELDVLSNTLIFCDNWAGHKTSALQNVYQYVDCMFNARYSPFLNPIEECFGTWKYYFRQREDTNIESMTEKIIECSLKVTKKACLGYFKHALMFHLKSLNSEKID